MNFKFNISVKGLEVKLNERMEPEVVKLESFDLNLEHDIPSEDYQAMVSVMKPVVESVVSDFQKFQTRKEEYRVHN